MLSFITLIIGIVLGVVITHFGYKESISVLKADLTNAELKVKTLLSTVIAGGSAPKV